MVEAVSTILLVILALEACSKLDKNHITMEKGVFLCLFALLECSMRGESMRLSLLACLYLRGRGTK